MNRLSLPSVFQFFSSIAKIPNLGWLETQVPWNEPWHRVNRLQAASHEMPPLGWFHQAEGGNNSVLWVTLVRDLGVISAWYFCFSFSAFAITLWQRERGTFIVNEQPLPVLGACATPGAAPGTSPCSGHGGWNQNTSFHPGGEGLVF